MLPQFFGKRPGYCFCNSNQSLLSSSEAVWFCRCVPRKRVFLTSCEQDLNSSASEQFGSGFHQPNSDKPNVHQGVEIFSVFTSHRCQPTIFIFHVNLAGQGLQGQPFPRNWQTLHANQFDSPVAFCQPFIGQELPVFDGPMSVAPNGGKSLLKSCCMSAATSISLSTSVGENPSCSFIFGRQSVGLPKTRVC